MLKSEIRSPKPEIPQSGTKSECALARAGLIRISGFALRISTLFDLMLEQLKKNVCQANLDLVKEGLVIQTWGNASGIDREHNLVVIKPSGVPYAGMMPDHMVVVSLETGKVIDGYLIP